MENLVRYPYRKNDLLQAWDSADELMLQHLEKENLTDKKILIINDHFGALSSRLKEYNPTVFTDSYVSSQGIKINTNDTVKPIHSLKDLKGIYHYVLIKIPKGLAFFEDILCHLTHHLDKNSEVICAGMLKHLPPSSFNLLQTYIGATTTSLAYKKARLIFAKCEKGPADSPYPLKIILDGFEKEFTNHSNLFSREKLDIGSRFFLENIPRGNFSTILDLGCANGVIGIKAKILNPSASIIFSDESAMAIESARLNYNKHYQNDAEFHWINCFENGKKDSVDLVLCNPPFHQSTTVGDFIAWQMFTDSKNVLKKGGLIRVIGNSHLGYQQKLNKIFGNSKVVATNKKFMIIDAFQS